MADNQFFAFLPEDVRQPKAVEEVAEKLVGRQAGSNSDPQKKNHIP